MTERIRYRRDDEGKRHRVVLNEGHEGFVVRWVDSCSGCHETNQGYSLGCYAYDEKVRCEVGFGCHECGYTGKQRQSWWVPFDMTAWSKHVNETEERFTA